MRLTLTLLGLLIIITSFSQVSLMDSELPILKLNTNSTPIVDDPRVTCEMEIIDNGPGQINNVNDPASFTGFITIEIRGSTSQQYPKKNYGFSTVDPMGNNMDVPLMDMPPENDWILYGPYPDKTLIRNVMTFNIFRQMGHYASNTRYCEMLIDGEYKGIYILMEKIKRDAGRVDVTPLDSLSISGIELTGGYVFKVDKTTGTTVETFASAYNPEVLFQYHDPGPDELHSVQKSYLQSYISDFEDVLDGPNFGDVNSGYHNLIDKESFFDFFIMEELGRTVDGYRSSSFLYKDRENIWGGKIHAGPIWDFNLSYGNADYCEADQVTGWQYEFDNICPWFTSSVPFWWGKLLTDSTYSNGLKCRWEYLRQGPLHVDSLHNFVDSVATKLEAARIRNFQQWPIIGVYVNWNGYVGSTYQEDVDYLKWYLENRIAWMDANLPGTCWPEMLSESQQISEIPQFRIWPNPAVDMINIGFTRTQSGLGKIELYSVDGRLIQVQDFTNLAEGNYLKQLDLSILESGQYLIRILQNEELIGSQKIVKQ
ncbi:MAG: hypothetical protein ACI857_002563 [Arenicella sp.]|jgi:hypothetical protein